MKKLIFIIVFCLFGSHAFAFSMENINFNHHIINNELNYFEIFIQQWHKNLDKEQLVFEDITEEIFFDTLVLNFDNIDEAKTFFQNQKFILRGLEHDYEFILPKESYEIKKSYFRKFFGILIMIDDDDILNFTGTGTVLDEDIIFDTENSNIIEKIVIEINPIILKQRLYENFEYLFTEAQDVKITKEGENIIFEGTAENGQYVDIEVLYHLLCASIRSDHYVASMPMNFVRGKVIVEGDNLNNLKIKELLATGVSDFSTSSYSRIHNIKLGMSKYNGLIIRRGETFSFNENLGPVNAATGYLPELVIKGPETIPEYGGGLCQVSTTMYRAVLLSGLPILERRNHSYAVSYYSWPYGWGFDATIYPGSADLIFINDTPGDILVQAYVEGTKAYYKFYGISDGRYVRLDGPYVYNYRGVPPPVHIVDNSLAPGVKIWREGGIVGFNADFYRYIYFSDGHVERELVRSVYQARPNVYRVGPTPIIPEPVEEPIEYSF